MLIGAPSSDLLLCGPDKFMDPSLPIGLWWCKDERDMMAVMQNAVCKNPVAEWSEMTCFADFVSRFPYILVAVPPGPERDEIANEVSLRFNLPVLLPKEKQFKGCGSVYDLLAAGGPQAVEALLIDTDELPVEGLLELAKVDISDRDERPRVVSGFRGLDRSIGGFRGGELSVWTGKRGEGKSTLLGQLLLEAVNQCRFVCVYSGELPAKQFKLSLLQQAAGPYNVKERATDTGRVFYDANPAAIRRIDEWWGGRLFLTDIKGQDAHNEDRILSLFEYAHRRHGCDVFLADNIMTAELKEEAAIGYWRAQSAFTGRLAAFAKRFGVHVHLVAHPRKTGKATVEADDVGGSSDITNRADNVLKVERLSADEEARNGFSTGLTILKNREFGARERIRLCFDEPSRRFYEVDGAPTKKYSWELEEQG